MLETRTATTDAEREAIYRFRYTVYVEELGRYVGTADHAGGRLVDPEDEGSWLVYATDTDTGAVVGSFRLTWGGVGFSQRQIAQYGLAPFLAEIPPERVLVGERTMVAPAWRGSDVFGRMTEASAALTEDHDVRVSFGACEPHLVGFYAAYQRTFAPRNINTPEAGYLVPMVSFPQGPEALAEFGPGDGSLPRCVADALAGTGTVSCAAYDGRDEYVARVVAELAALPGSVFEGLDAEQVARCIDRSCVIACAEGDRLLKRGGSARNAFVVLSGALEVTDGDHVVGVALPGEMVGEMALLLRRPRSFDVDVLSDDTRVLSLSERTLRDLRTTDPTSAATLFANISRLLCERMAPTC